MPEKKRVFVIEDNETILESVKRLLELSGFEVGTTMDAREALEKVKAFKPRIILLDLLMPNMGGIEICQILNNDAQTRGIPIIVVSALAKEVDIKKAYELGVVGYIVKPYDFSDLLKEINKVIAYKEKVP